MKISDFSKFIGAGVIAASLAVAPLTVSAQTQTQNTAPNTDTRTTGDVQSVNTEDDFDWGWLGLLGLAGLAGLAGLKRRETVYRSGNNPNVAVGSHSDYH